MGGTHVYMDKTLSQEDKEKIPNRFLKGVEVNSEDYLAVMAFIPSLIGWKLSRKLNTIYFKQK